MAAAGALICCVTCAGLPFAAARASFRPGETFHKTSGGAAISDQDNQEPTAARPNEMVFLLHGIGKGKYDMAALARRLRREGYAVVNWGYPSTELSLADLADKLAEQVERFPNYKIHFVTHSMGGIVVRTYFSRHTLQNPGRLVMIAPPSQGAELAQFFGNWPIYQYLMGPAGQELRPGDAGKCIAAGIPPVEFGIIAGGTGTRIGINPLLPGDNDGTVTLESTKLEGAQDFAVVPYPHPVIQMMPKTIDLTIRFLNDGRFTQ
jgi:hypothetical protein